MLQVYQLITLCEKYFHGGLSVVQAVISLLDIFQRSLVHEYEIKTNELS